MGRKDEAPGGKTTLAAALRRKIWALEGRGQGEELGGCGRSSQTARQEEGEGAWGESMGGEILQGEPHLMVILQRGVKSPHLAARPQFEAEVATHLQ